MDVVKYCTNNLIKDFMVVPSDVTSLLFFTTVSFIFLWYVQFLWKRRYLYIYSWNVPGPIAFPFIGSAYIFITQQTDNVTECLTNMQKTFPDVFKVWLGTKLFYIVSRPEHNKILLNNPKAQNKDSAYEFMSEVVGDGLISSKVQKWKKHRKLFSPGFSQKALDCYQLLFVRNGAIFVDLLQKEVGNKDFDLLKMLVDLNLENICEVATGVHMGIQKGNFDVSQNLAKGLEITSDRMFKARHQLKFTWNLYPISKKYKHYIDKLYFFRDWVIKKKMEAIKTQRNTLVVEECKKQVTLLDHIFENSNFTEEEQTTELNVFLIGGADTSAAAICLIFVMLGMFPEVQQKVLQEMLQVLGSNEEVTPSDLHKMKYTERVIKETLRIFPIVPVFLRHIESDIKLEDMIYPAGATLLFAPITIHRNPKYWPDPLKFDPDRFLPENTNKRHPYSYLAFSQGARNCIGKHFSMMNMKTVVATVIRRFKIYTEYKSVEEVECDMKIFLKIKDGPKVWVEGR